MMQITEADILIAGGGLAGLTLAMECAGHSFFDNKRIIIIDRDDKTKNDRTWCFWATADEPVPPVVHHSWDKCRFFGPDFDRLLDIQPFQYHMIRGIDFYNFAKKTLALKNNIQWVLADIGSVDPISGTVYTNAGIFRGNLVFDSARQEKLAANRDNPRFTHLLQHFKGWLVQTKDGKFDPAVMTFMDYRVAQKGDTRFVYVLPLSTTQALVEYTVFSPAVCPMEEYDSELQAYLRDHLKIDDFEIQDTEFGVIPMTDFPLRSQGGRVLHIGTAGGFVKGSSGYAFKRTQRKIHDFVKNWVEKGRPDPTLLRSNWRFRFYDSVMLRVLKERAMPGSNFFSQLFRRLPATLVFRFLDEDTTFAEDIQLLRVPPTWIFLKSALKQIPVLSKL